MNLSTTWRPPSWREIEEGIDPTPEECVKLHDAFKKAGYYTSGGALTPKGQGKADSDEAATVRHNVALLRDAWNTNGLVWQLAAKLTGVDFKVDPFYNPGATDLDCLAVKLNGRGDQEDTQRKSNGLALSEETVMLEVQDFVAGKITPRKLELKLPLNWYGHDKGKLKRGQAPAAVNGPHSNTGKWLKLCVAQGQREIVAAFVPDNGDGWFQQWGLTAQLVVRLGRVHCNPAPSIKKSSPRGASALLIWIPEDLRAGLPKATRACITKGTNFRVPFHVRPIAGMQYAFVQGGAVNKIVDLGLLA